MTSKLKISIVSFFILLAFATQSKAQNYTDLDYYLVDSLNVKNLNNSDASILDSCLNLFHKEVNDTLKVLHINTLVENAYSTDVWPKYNNWIYQHCNEMLSVSKDEGLIKFYSLAKAGAINNFGYLDQYNYQLDQALNNYNASILIYKDFNDSSSIANGLNNIGSVYFQKSDVVNAMVNYNESLNIRQLINDEFGLANSYNNIGYAYQYKGDLAKAIDYYEKSLSIRERLDDKGLIATQFNNIGLVYLELDNGEKAKKYFSKALELDSEIGNEYGVGYDLANLGRAQLLLKNYLEASNDLDKAFKIFKKISAKHESGEALLSLAQVALERNQNFNKSISIYKGALEIFDELESASGRVDAYEGLASNYLKLGQPNMALEHCLKAESFANQMESIHAKKKVAECLVAIYKELEEKESLNLKELELSSIIDSLDQIAIQDRLDLLEAERIMNQNTDLASQEKNKLKNQAKDVALKNLNLIDQDGHVNLYIFTGVGILIFVLMIILIRRRMS